MSKKVKVNGKEFSVSVLSKSSDSVVLEIDGKEYQVELENKSSSTSFIPRKKKKKKAGSDATQNSKEIRAPMPGIVSQVNIKEGDIVSKGDAVLVIEAMKMENNIPSSRDGKISKVHVAKGNDVEKDQLLISIE